MKKALNVLVLVSALLAPCPAGAYYSPYEVRPKKDYLLRLGLRGWDAASSGQTRMSLVTPSSWWVPAADHITMGATSDYKRMSAFVGLVTAELQPARGLYFVFDTAYNRFSDGKYHEHDWVHANDTIIYWNDGTTWNSPQHRDFGKKTMQTSGTARQYTAAMYFTVYRGGGRGQDGTMEPEHRLDLMFGYRWYETRVRLFNGYNVISTQFFIPTPPAGELAGLDSRARARWYGVVTGLRDRAVVGKNFTAEAKFLFGPTLKYRGREYWNLDPLLANPGVLTAATGHLAEFELSAAYKLLGWLELEAGYTASTYRAAFGRNLYRYADGTTREGRLDRVKATRKGLFVGLSCKY